jgi:hypothetical protein
MLAGCASSDEQPEGLEVLIAVAGIWRWKSRCHASGCGLQDVIRGFWQSAFESYRGCY